MGQGVVDLDHVTPHHDLWQAAGGGEGLDVLRSTLDVAPVAARQLAVEKPFTGFGRNGDELLDGKLLKRGARLGDPPQVFAEDARVDLADHRHGLAGEMMTDFGLIEAFVGFASAQSRQMREIHKRAVCFSVGRLGALGRA